MAQPAFGLDQRPGLSDDPYWYRTAVFYEVLLRAFSDSTGEGAWYNRSCRYRLDYLQLLGVDCSWLPTCWPSPLRDGGYDVADYCLVDPAYGTLDDFQELLHEAHDRCLRIVIDLVRNHTSE